jgi:hypothetical protein
MKRNKAIGRPKKQEGEHLKLCSIGLREDQVNFLDSLPSDSRSAAARKAIDFFKKNVCADTLTHSK